jgi:2-polyprenyl-3-methyl-5-hydroxy-6-metoxy-1,4-benzoquinol methylase
VKIKGNIESNESFYSAIASEYNTRLTNQDIDTRKSISEIFKQKVPHGSIMDFGGGTGLDLPWMLEHNYNVFFLEPSAGMRSVAKENPDHTGNLVFVETNMDYRDWTLNNLPIKGKLTGVLANFAVLNCLENVQPFFEKISMLLDANGYLIVTVIDPAYRSISGSYSLVAALKLNLLGQLEILNQHKGIFHSTFIHSLRSLKRKSKPYFNLESCVSMRDSNFIVMQFRRA